MVPRRRAICSHVRTAVSDAHRHLLDPDSLIQQLPLSFLLGERAEHEHIVLCCLDHARLRRQAQPRVHDDPQQRPAPRTAAAVRKQRIVRDDRAHAHHDGVVAVTKLLHVAAGNLAGNPSAGGASTAQRRGLVQTAWRRSDFPVQRHGRLERDQRRVMANVFGEGFIQRFSFFFQNA